MASIDEFSVPAYALDWLRGLGYEPYTSMDGEIRGWWEWFTARAGWYDQTGWDSVNRKKVSYRKYSIRPARRVCREWASLMFDEGTSAVAADGAADAWMRAWAARTGFMATARECTERAFALGTGALALWFDVPEDAAKPVKMRARRYDARMVLPLSWDDDGCTECAFSTRVHVKGKPCTQVSAHVVGENGYEIRTALFDGRGKQVDAEGVIKAFETMQPNPTFCLISPAIDNVVADCAPLGQSVFDDAINAVKAVDDTFDSMVRELLVCKPRVFMDDMLINPVDKNGKRVLVPSAPEETVIRSVMSASGGDLIKTFQPDIRADQIRRMLDTALAELGDLTGFGQQYFTLERSGGPKTATEVSADSSALMRNLRKHEAAAGEGLSRLLSAAISCARTVCGEPVGDSEVSVSWDDSIVEDTPAEKTQMQAEIAAGIASAWEYRAKFYGETEQDARERASEASGGIGTGIEPNAPQTPTQIEIGAL